MSVRLAVRPSVTRRYSDETAKHILKLIFTIVLVSPNQTVWHIPTGTPNRVVECSGYEKIAIFDKYLALSQK